MPSRRQIAFVRSLAVVVGGALVIWFGGAAIVEAVLGRTPAAAPWLALAKFASLAWVAAFGWATTWGRLDEMAKETRKLSWFIGSTAAILLTAPVMLLWLLSGGEWLARVLGRHGTPGAYFALGWGGLALAQLLSTMVARAGWAARR